MDQCSSAQLACGCMFRALTLHGISRAITGRVLLHLVRRNIDFETIQSVSVSTGRGFRIRLLLMPDHVEEEWRHRVRRIGGGISQSMVAAAEWKLVQHMCGT